MIFGNYIFCVFTTYFLSEFSLVRGEPWKWRETAQQSLQSILSKRMNTKVAKNVVLIIGDGMSLSTIAAARILKGQRAGRSGIGEEMLYETFPYVGLARTFATDKYVPDSASTATAFLCGAKANFHTVGVDDRTRLGECQSVKGNELRCIGEWALAEGKSVGLVTNMRVTHATPAPLYAHSADRAWEDDRKIPLKDLPICKDIARQLVEDYPGRNIQVILGGGREAFMPNTTFDPEYPEKRGKRTDNHRLIDFWKSHKESRKVSHKYVWNKRQFDKVDPQKTDYLLGLFEISHMHDVAERDKANLSEFDEPTLAEMTAKALQILSKNPSGYFLLVEGGLIDSMHHTGRAVRALSEAVDFENAVQTALNLTTDDTLVVVSADHSHGLIFAGYASVGEDIFGIAEISNVDKMPYTTLLYSTGPGFSPDPVTGRKNISGINTAHKDYKQQAVLPRSSVTHSGEDVAVYATGPMSHLFSGVFDQQYIAHAMAYAACIGSNKDHCTAPELSRDCNSSARICNFSVIVYLIFLFVFARNAMSSTY